MDWDSSGYDCIAELAEALSQHEGESVSLQGRTLSFSLRRIAHFPAKYIRVAMWPKRPEKRKGTDKWPLFSLAPITYPATVCSMAGTGTALMDGTLEMPEHSCLVLDDGCKDFTLSSITFSGEPFRVPLPLQNRCANPCTLQNSTFFFSLDPVTREKQIPTHKLATPATCHCHSSI